MSDDDRPSDPADLSVGSAVDRFIGKNEVSKTDRTIRAYRSRLEQFVKWCRERDIERVGDLDPWIIDEYDLSLRGEVAPTTLKSRLSTLRVFLEYCHAIDAVDEDVVRAVNVPTLDRSEEQSETRLAPDDAIAALEFFRDSRIWFGTPRHAFLELAWHTGARMGTIRGLDISDYHPDEQYVEFRHRPSTGTPLKNKNDAERFVGLAEPVVDALQMYIARERSEKRDEHGREPLFCTRQGRPSFTTLRAWSYQATHPCLWTECPHGKRRDSCEWTERTHASKCPSSRSPHRIRTGSITWQLNQGLSIDVVSERVNASPSVIRQHYDQAAVAEEFEERRRAAETALDISDSEQ